MERLVLKYRNGEECPVPVGADLVVKVDRISRKGELVSVEIPEGVLELGANLFDGCTSLTSISLPSSLKVIGDAAFKGCRSLKEISIPASVKYIYQNTFEGCSSLPVYENVR